MKRWGLRHRLFRVGFIGIVVCSFFFLVGFASPAWQSTQGLWIHCNSDSRMCISHDSSLNTFQLPAWFDAVRAFESFSLLWIILCIASEVYMDFISRPAPDRRVVELFALLGGAFGLVGAIIFATFSPMTSEQYLSWGFALCTASSCFTLAFASIIAFYRRKGLDHRNYAASNAIHYRPSEGVILPPSFNGTDIAPPPYSEVVGHPPVRPGPSQMQGGHLKPVIPADCVPPPYYPPPPSGHLEAPPPYAASTSQSQMVSSVTSSQLHRGEGESILPQMNANAAGGFSNPGSSFGGTDQPPPTLYTAPMPTPGSGVSSSGEGEPSCLPVYYVTVLGQAVPVFREELQQAGVDNALLQQFSPPLPAYFIEMQGHHVPVYSEEQARALNRHF